MTSKSATPSKTMAVSAKSTGRLPLRKKDSSARESVVDEHVLSVVEGNDAQDHHDAEHHSAEGHDHSEGHLTHGNERDSGEFPHDEEVGNYFAETEAPSCAGFHKFYCDYSEDYPT